MGCGRRKGLCAPWREEADKCIIGKAGGGVAALGSNTEGRQREGCFVVGRKWKEEVLMRDICLAKRHIIPFQKEAICPWSFSAL